MSEPDRLPAICIVGRKNSGKTTLTVALAAELGRRGRRVATIKHGHHAFETDEPGRDSWRHFHEGGAEATIMAGTGKVALVMRIDGEPEPERLIAEHYAGRGYDVVLVEGWKHGLLPKIEVFRRELHATTLWETMDEERAAMMIAIVTDDAAGVDALLPTCPVVPLDPPDPLHGAHVARVADLVESLLL